MGPVIFNRWRGGGGVYQGEGQEKILLCKGAGVTS